MQVFEEETGKRVIRGARIAESIPIDTAPGAAGLVGNQCITAKMLAQDGTDLSKFSWQQEIRKPGGWQTISNGLSGTTSKNPAYQIDETSTDDISGTHVILVRAPMRDADGNPIVSWIIAGGADETSNAVVVKITALAGDGEYTGLCGTGTPTGGDITAMTFAGDNVTIINCAEIGLSGHTQVVGSYHEGVKIGDYVLIDASTDDVGVGDADYQILQMNGGARVWDWLRAH